MRGWGPRQQAARRAQQQQQRCNAVTRGPALAARRCAPAAAVAQRLCVLRVSAPRPLRPHHASTVVHAAVAVGVPAGRRGACLVVQGLVGRGVEVNTHCVRARVCRAEPCLSTRCSKKGRTHTHAHTHTHTARTDDNADDDQEQQANGGRQAREAVVACLGAQRHKRGLARGTRSAQHSGAAGDGRGHAQSHNGCEGCWRVLARAGTGVWPPRHVCTPRTSPPPPMCARGPHSPRPSTARTQSQRQTAPIRWSRHTFRGRRARRRPRRAPAARPSRPARSRWAARRRAGRPAAGSLRRGSLRARPLRRAAAAAGSRAGCPVAGSRRPALLAQGRTRAALLAARPAGQAARRTRPRTALQHPRGSQLGSRLLRGAAHAAGGKRWRSAQQPAAATHARAGTRTCMRAHTTVAPGASCQATWH
jgi:hypothetical protein